MRTPQETAENMVKKYGQHVACTHASGYAMNHRFDAIDRGEEYPNEGERYWREVLECISQLCS